MTVYTPRLYLSICAHKNIDFSKHRKMWRKSGLRNWHISKTGNLVRLWRDSHRRATVSSTDLSKCTGSSPRGRPRFCLTGFIRRSRLLSRESPLLSLGFESTVLEKLRKGRICSAYDGNLVLGMTTLWELVHHEEVAASGCGQVYRLVIDPQPVLVNPCSNCPFFIVPEPVFVPLPSQGCVEDHVKSRIGVFSSRFRECREKSGSGMRDKHLSRSLHPSPVVGVE